MQIYLVTANSFVISTVGFVCKLAINKKSNAVL